MLEVIPVLSRMPLLARGGVRDNSIFHKSQESHELRIAKSAIAARHIR